MKKLLLTLAVLCLLAARSFAQEIPNADFEDWHQDTGFAGFVDMPDGWVTTGIGDPDYDEPVLKSTDAYSGDYCPKLVAIDFPGGKFPAVLGAEILVDKQTSRYLNGHFKGDFDPQTDTFLIEVGYYDDQNDSFYVVGARASGSPEDWEPFNIDVNAEVGWDTAYIGIQFYGEVGAEVSIDSIYFSEDSIGGSFAPAYIQSSSGIRPEKVLSLSHVKAYPNPANDHTTLEFVVWQRSNVTVQLYDLNGRLVKTVADKKSMNGPQKMNISTAELKNGIYLCTINTGKKVVTQKIIVNR